MKLEIGSKIVTKKPHPCGGNVWTVVRTGADYKIKCETCGRIIMLTPTDLEKRVKSIVESK